MAQPTAYNRLASFRNIQALAPSDPLPGSTLDAELNAIKVTLDEVLDNLALVQRDDGALANESVGPDQLSAELAAGINPWTVWVTGEDYAVGDTVFRTSAVYRCPIAHTAGTFSTDLSAGKWEMVIDFSALTLAAASGIAFTPSGAIAATNVQAALVELDTDKAATSHDHPASAINDGTAAGRALLTAANAAAQRAALGLGDLATEDTVPVTEIDANLSLTGIIEPTTLAADTNDWAPTGIATASTIRMSASSAVALTGLLAPTADGEVKILENVGATYPITLSPSSSASASANRFLIPKPIVVGVNSSVALRYDAGDDRWRLLDRSATLPRNWIDGLTISNNGSDATNDIDIAAGEARGSRGLLDLVLSTAITGKQLDASWAAGSSAGMREATAIADGTYHIFLIGKSDGTTDIFAYTGVDPTAVLPSGYIDYRRIGSILRASSTIRPFSQVGNEFLLKTPVNAATLATTATTTARDVTVAVPTGIKVTAILNVIFASSSTVYLRVYSPDQTDVSVTSSNGVLTSSNDRDGARLQVRTGTSANVRDRSSGAIDSIYGIACEGWIDARGRE